MKEVNIKDTYTSMKLLMCEKHFSFYQPHMDKAARGGTSYSFKKTNRRGCELCKRKRENCK